MQAIAPVDEQTSSTVATTGQADGQGHFGNIYNELTNDHWLLQSDEHRAANTWHLEDSWQAREVINSAITHQKKIKRLRVPRAYQAQKPSRATK